MYGQPNYYYPQPQPRMIDYMPQQYTQNTNIIKGRPVSSIDEVKAAQIDFDGSIFIFPDAANKKIYTKQINLDGTASLNTYTLEIKNTTENSYVTKDEFNQALAEVKNMIEQKHETQGVKNNHETINF